MTITPRVSKSDARTLWRGTLVIALIVGIGKGVPALRRVEADVRSSADEAAQELSSLRAASRGQRAMQDSLIARRKRLEAVQGRLVRGATPQLAAADLATTLSGYAVDAGARVNATIVRADSAFTKGMARVVVRMTVTTDIQGIGELLRFIETDPWLLSARELTLSASDPGAPENRAETIVTELVVEGLAGSEAKKK